MLMEFDKRRILLLALAFRINGFACLIQQIQFHFCAFQFLKIRITQFKIQTEIGICVKIIQIRYNFKVTNVGHRACVHIDITLNAGETPEVLVFQIITITKLKYLYCDFILATNLQEICDIELGRSL